ncbi:hypothetical protein [Kitasatospora sp. NPDC059827]|uniref:hypothetical protein n=1 Tax=Kitasatospora sp. NPDC059827 TaxID=3346964 RepID=UPI00365073B8
MLSLRGFEPAPPQATGRTEFRGIRGALMLALAEVLGSEGFTVTARGADLLVTAGPYDPGDAPTLTAAFNCPAPRRNRPACQVAAM